MTTSLNRLLLRAVAGLSTLLIAATGWAQSGARPTEISVDEFHKITAMGTGTGKLAVQAFITGNNIGMAMLCKSSMGYGACNDRDPQTRVDLGLDSRRASALYDARGSGGKIICALIVMNGGQRPRMMDFRPDACPSSW